MTTQHPLSKKFQALALPFGRPWVGETGSPLADFKFEHGLDDTTGRVELELQIDAEQGQEGGIEGALWVGWRRRLHLAKNERVLAQARTDQVFTGNNSEDPFFQCSAAYYLVLEGSGGPVEAVSFASRSQQIASFSLFTPDEGEYLLLAAAVVSARLSGEGAWPQGPICQLRGAFEGVWLDERQVLGIPEKHKIEGRVPSFLDLVSR